mmetsp:Transcript_25610/g.37847  ORF Transcript_25610/g.37847 Transcript_25610/m.37847 type:complete len:176 (+) Transcript_25610:215-742(+)
MLSGATAKAIVRRSRPKCSALSSQINSFVLLKRTYTSNPPAHSPLLEGTNHKCHRYNPSAERASSSCAATVPEPEEKIVNFLDNTIRLVIEAEKEGQGMLLSNALSSTKKTERMTEEELQMRVDVFEVSLGSVFLSASLPELQSTHQYFFSLFGCCVCTSFLTNQFSFSCSFWVT